MKNKRVIYETDPSAEWYTPRHLRELATEILHGVDLDPATCAENPIGASAFLTAADGLPSVELWASRLPLDVAGKEAPSVFLNPPYGRETSDWLAMLEALHGLRECNSLALVPCRPGSRWYTRATGPEGFDLVCELHGRVSFDTRNAAGVIVAGKVPARWACVLLYRGGPYASALGLRWMRDKLARVGSVRLSGRARRLRARRGTHARQGRPRTPADPRQVPLWPTNVIPMQPSKKGKRP